MSVFYHTTTWYFFNLVFFLEKRITAYAGFFNRDGICLYIKNKILDYAADQSLVKYKHMFQFVFYSFADWPQRGTAWFYFLIIG